MVHSSTASQRGGPVCGVRRCRPWPIAVAIAWCVPVITASEAQAVLGEEATLVCGTDELSAWRRLRVRIREQVPRLSARLPFTLYRSDMPLLEGIQQEMEQLGISDALLSGTVLPRTTGASECTFGLLALRILMVLMQVGVLPSSAPRAAVDLVPAVLALPWVQVLLSGWPVFTALAVLVRWTSPYADKILVDAAGTHARAAFQAVAHLPAARCDSAEIGALPMARGHTGRHWRHRDPVVAILADGVTGVTRSQKQIEGIIAGTDTDGLQSNIWGGAAGKCRWTEHPDSYLGGLVGDPLEDGQTLLEAMAACDREAACAGVTVGPDPDNPDLLRPTLRHGQPFLAASPSGEVSFARWCGTSASTAAKSPADQEASEAHAAPCPFPRVAGLLAVALRRLSGGSMRDFAPELVIDAQGSFADWASIAGEATGLEAWVTEWPLWELLGHLEQRLDLISSDTTRTETPSEVLQPSWSVALQRALGFDDQAWRLATEELASLAVPAAAQSERSPEHDQPVNNNKMPTWLRKDVRCDSGARCAGELFARLHLLLYGSGRLPLRDPIFPESDDVLAPVMMERGKALVDGPDYDWGKMIQEGADRTEVLDAYSRPEELDRLMPTGHPLQVDRRQLARFVLEVRSLIADKPFGRCLEWDQPFLLVRAFQGICRWFDIFSYSEPTPEEPRMGMPGRHEYPHGTRHYWGDLEYPDGLGIEPDTFDLIMCPFVFEHVSRPFFAMRNLARVLKSGGYVIWAAPMFQQYHGSPHDYFRYTPKGARALAEDAGLEVVKVYAPGDLALTSGVLMGMMLPYWTEAQALREVEPAYGEDSPRFPLNVFALFRKPPSKQNARGGSQGRGCRRT